MTDVPLTPIIWQAAANHAAKWAIAGLVLAIALAGGADRASATDLEGVSMRGGVEAVNRSYESWVPSLIQHNDPSVGSGENGLVTGPSLADQIAQSPPAEGGGALFENADEAARQTSNPLGGDFMVLINEWNFDFYDGDLPGADNKESITHIFQPVIPFSMAETIGPDWILVNRPTLPIIYTADVPSGGFNPAFPPGDDPSPGVSFSSKSGVADISHFSLLGTSVPSENALFGKGDRVLAGGVSLNIPSGDSTFTNDAWAAGPAAVGAYIGEKGVLGVLAQTQFDFAGDEDYEIALVQPFYYVNLSGGWQVGGAPLWQFDFDTKEQQIPIGMGVQKTHLFSLGDGAIMPVRFGLEGRYHVERNDAFGPKYSIVFSISPILPNVFSNLMRGCPLMSVGGC